MQKITPNLWFDTQAEEAAHFYVSVFNGNPAKKVESKVGEIARYGDSGAEVSGMSKGAVMTAAFELEGERFVGINGGSAFKLTEAVSFQVDCKDQEEVDYFWNRLTEGGEESVCGWLKDKFGLSWQIVPTVLGKMAKDPEKGEKVMKAMFQMKKIEIKALEQAYKD